MKIGVLRLGNKRNYSVHQPELGEVVIPIHRPAVLGNPHYSKPRYTSIALFKNDFEKEMERGEGTWVEAVKEIVNNLLAGRDVILMCWCHPLACHGDVIKAEVEKQIEKLQTV